MIASCTRESGGWVVWSLARSQHCNLIRNSPESAHHAISIVTFKMMNWLRKLVRGNIRPIPTPTAQKWDFRLSLFYGFLTWNAFGYIMYLIFTGRSDMPELIGPKDKTVERTPSERFAETLGIKKAHVIQFTGFKKVGEFDIDLTSTEENKSTEKEKSTEEKS